MPSPHHHTSIIYIYYNIAVLLRNMQDITPSNKNTIHIVIVRAVGNAQTACEQRWKLACGGITRGSLLVHICVSSNSNSVPFS